MERGRRLGLNLCVHFAWTIALQAARSSSISFIHFGNMFDIGKGYEVIIGHGKAMKALQALEYKGDLLASFHDLRLRCVSGPRSR